jgi:hypothetical protein
MRKIVNNNFKMGVVVVKSKQFKLQMIMDKDKNAQAHKMIRKTLVMENILAIL